MLTFSFILFEVLPPSPVMAENQIIRDGTIFPRRPARDRLSNPLPAGIERHRFELLALISWVGLFWGTYNTTPRNYEGLVENWFLPGSSLTQLAFGIADLCRAFTLLVRNHIDTHGLHPRCLVSFLFYLLTDFANLFTLLLEHPSHILPQLAP
ncbi:hypothetical protein N7524_011882 [Penicillium chrysogenum]|nr:hypothetical protein N7524_011663 [Penicillium chrysogenum]KAJ5249566.1 hypothetical protein N7524_011882 [Penicillium chrysogenum]